MKHIHFDSHRRRAIGLLLGALSALVLGERANAVKKPVAKKPVKKPVRKAPVKPVAQSTPTPKASPTPSPSASPSTSTTASPNPTTSASNSPAPAASPSSGGLPSNAKALTVAGKNLTVADLAVGATTVATFPKSGLTTAVLVSRIDEKTFVALKPICTHAGGPVELSGSSLLCAWHGSRFNQRTGAVINGPAGDPLTKENVALFGDVLYYVP